MAKLLTGREAASALTAALHRRTAALAKRGVTPKLAILRCGENESDGAYLRSAQQRAALCGVVVEVTSLPETVSRETLLSAIDDINCDASVHGCLLLRPLPAHLRDAEDAICNRLLPEKDVDGMTDVSAAGVYLGRPQGFAPCTAEAVTVLLDHYGIDCAGKRAVVIGRSPVVGRPAAMLLRPNAMECSSRSMESKTFRMSGRIFRALAVGIRLVPFFSRREKPTSSSKLLIM